MKKNYISRIKYFMLTAFLAGTLCSCSTTGTETGTETDNSASTSTVESSNQTDSVTGESSVADESVTTSTVSDAENTYDHVLDKEAIATKVELKKIKDKDRFVIVSDDTGRTVSSVHTGDYLVGLSTRSSDQGLTYIPKQAEIFTIEKLEDGNIMFKGENGYLAANESGGLYFTEQASKYCIWVIKDNDMLYNPGSSVHSAEKKQEMYLEYYDGDRRYSTYSYAEGDDTAPFLLSFYKLAENYEVPEDQGGGYRLPLIETSDVHGYIADTSGDDPKYMYAWIADKVNDVRESTGEYREDTMILLDGGDFFQGSVLSNLLEGEPVSEIFATMHYDAVTIGNHEFDWGIENVIDADATLMDYEIDGQTCENTTPVITSNLYKDGEKVTFANDYIILDKTAMNEQGEEVPVRVGVIGFAEDYSSSIMYKMFTGAGYEIREDYDALVRLAASLKESEACDAVVLLSHYDAPELAGKLEMDTEIDLILGGHMHMNDMGENSRGLVYVMPQGNGNGYSYSELVFDLDADGKPVFRAAEATTAVSVNANEEQLYSTDENTEELKSDIVEITDEAIAEVSVILDEKIGYITKSSDRYTYFPDSAERSSLGGNWHSSIIARSVGAEVGFMNRYGMRVDLFIPDGQDRRDVTVADIYEMFPFNNTIYCFELTYADLLSVFEYSLTSRGSSLFTMVSGIDCYFTDTTVNALVKDGVVLYKDGEWIDGHDQDTIRVAASEYLATTDREDSGLTNPLVTLKDTDKLVSNDTLDVEGALKVLREEAAANDGLLSIDTASHFICGEYEG